MKKTFLYCIIFVLCAAMLSVTAFADNAKRLDGSSIYVRDPDKLAKAIDDNKGSLKLTLNSFGITIDAATAMPLFIANLYEYAESGEFSFVPFDLDGGQLYSANALDAKGSFAGTAVFAVDGDAPDVLMYAPAENGAKSVDFNDNSKRIASLMSRIDNTMKIVDAKYVFVDGLGFVYYIDTGVKRMFIASGFKGTNGSIFTAENGGVIEIGPELLRLAGVEAEKIERIKESNANRDPEDNVPTGSGIPSFIVENSLDMPSGRDSAPVVFAAVVGAAVLCVAAMLYVNNGRKERDRT